MFFRGVRTLVEVLLPVPSEFSPFLGNSSDGDNVSLASLFISAESKVTLLLFLADASVFFFGLPRFLFMVPFDEVAFPSISLKIL